MARAPTGGFDDNFCVTQGTEQKLTFVSRAIHPKSGRVMEVYSDQPGVQFYTSNFLPDPFGNVIFLKKNLFVVCLLDFFSNRFIHPKFTHKIFMKFLV